MTNLRSRALAVLAILIAGSATSEADVVLDWNEIAVSVLPASETRIVAIAQLATFEAVNAVTHDYQPYLGTIDAPPGASPEAAAVAAAHAVLRHYVPDRATDLDAARERSLATILDGHAKKAGIKSPLTSMTRAFMAAFTSDSTRTLVLAWDEGWAHTCTATTSVHATMHIDRSAIGIATSASPAGSTTCVWQQ